MNDSTCPVDDCGRRVVSRGYCNLHYQRLISTGDPRRTRSGRARSLKGATCSVDECGKPVKSKGYCYAHYMKAWRYGTPTPVHERELLDLAGRRVGLLTVVKRLSGMDWLCVCDCGTETVVITGDLTRETTQSCGNRTKHHRKDDAEYEAAHSRVVRDRGGPARMFPCVDCGGQAQHWSYDHNDPDERESNRERIKGIPYSLNSWCYSPRCVSCHKTFDLGRKGNRIDVAV